MNELIASALSVLLLLLPLSSGQSAPQGQCQPDKINQLVQEILNCQSKSGGDPAVPPEASYSPPYPGSRYPETPNSVSGPNDLDFFGKGPFFISSSGSGSAGSSPPGSFDRRGPGGVLVSRPLPADVRPVISEGFPGESTLFIASPRQRPNKNNDPTLGTFFPSIFARGGAGPDGGEDSIRVYFYYWILIEPLFPGDGSGSSSSNNPAGGNPFQTDPNTRPINPFGPPPSFGFNPFGPSTFGGNPFGFGGSPPQGPGSAPPSNAFDIDFDEILRILKGLQTPDEDTDPKAADEPTNPDMDKNTTEGIIEVDTTMDPSSSSTDETTMADTTPVTSTEKPPSTPEPSVKP